MKMDTNLIINDAMRYVFVEEEHKLWFISPQNIIPPTIVHANVK
jgi:hypothetical protein